ncbi:MAG: hypothetical protein A3H62_03015 [Candidatus Ryanbacteria bacterium RIFCSPLOWO2_02_FULL_44_40]|nr:MAG: hypothetical protein A3H62_03015 [Candidatus Ryanbacteria bacterium RIFCSPLOWO2_02_FULL_44_40]
MMTDKKLSVVIPCFNEAKNIPELYERLVKTLKRLTSSYEIVFIDNNSTDGSEELYRTLAKQDKNVSVLFFSRNFGNSQYGYSAGTEYATGDAVIWMEGDLQDPPEVIERFVDQWLRGHEVVYGVRPKAVGSFFSRFGRRTFYRLFQKLSYLDIPRDAGDFAILDRRVVDIFNAMPERSRFVRGLRAWIGFKHTGVLYKRQPRRAGVSSNPSFRRNIWWARKFIFSFSYAPLEFIALAAFWVTVFSVAATVFLFIGAVVDRFSWIAVLAAFVVLWFFALVMIVLAVLAESISIIFEEVKQRPKYIIREILNDHRL